MSISSQRATLIPKPSPTMVADTFALVIRSANEWIAVVSQEQTKQREIRSWEKVQLEIIEVQKKFLLTALDKTFDERSENFRRLFDALDSALVSGAEDAAATVADILGGITDLA